MSQHSIAGDTLREQLRLTWSLAEHTLTELTDDECLWLPDSESWTVRPGPTGVWTADWIEPEPWPLPPMSLAWTLWHTTWLWSMVLNHSFGDATVSRSDVHWLGAEASWKRLRQLHTEWSDHLTELDDMALADSAHTRWPYDDGRPFAQIVSWVNMELMKNIAEMALTRRLYASQAINGRRGN